MPVELSIVESVTALETTVVEVILESASAPGPAGPGVAAGGTTGQALVKASNADYDTAWSDAGGGAPTTVDYLVGTSSGSLSAEIVVGTTPGGELGGTWASPTVDATHSGSSHAAVQAAAEATAAAALAAHEADATDAHDASAISNVPAGGIAATDVQAALNELDSEKAAAASAVMDGDAAGGVLSGTYPNPGFASDMATQAELDAHITDATDAHDASAISVLDSGAFYTGTDVEAVLAEIAPQLGGGSGELLERDIAQTTHGLAVGDVVRYNGTAFVKAQANSAANAEVVGIVSAVADVNNFTLHYGGRLSGLSGLVAGSTYFLDDDTAGLLTTTEPPDVGDISKPLLVADSATTGYFFNWRGAEVTAAATVAADDENLVLHMQTFA